MVDLVSCPSVFCGIQDVFNFSVLGYGCLHLRFSPSHLLSPSFSKEIQDEETLPLMCPEAVNKMDDMVLGFYAVTSTQVISFDLYNTGETYQCIELFL